MNDARVVFDTLPQPDVASWNALIAGYARQGDCERSLLCYEEMQRTGTRPSALTFLSLISACSHAGLVTEGVQYFESMSRDHSITPLVEHYVSIVDLLAREDTSAWWRIYCQECQCNPATPCGSVCLVPVESMTTSCWAKRAFDAVVSMQPKDASPYILMWNIYCHAGMWDKATHVDELRQNAGAWKKPGQSWIDHEQESHSFVAGEEKHPQQAQIDRLLPVGILCRELEKDDHNTLSGF